ncbi:MAG: hypothetical protein COV91_00685 [Candidatus Taylorbacteria bacterium CG11_big_fil_rev_8_21_14_0_20_46_11]|uniref:DUF805 domain-containing protein n=1 Tax=Candidatus Taylorbacteria bacterium CG11_big_fil_rev_8_21_14_0_20_46_11 TaxID=1975025 RepID=A0A2H0KCU2_9BACT|nr:MAG: hypothetical protein COV91_00685 [Candidatus Taylorbacteria bacterium CG11_big_fil_rev_8_21_14_0_20_46_11]
MPMLPRLIEGRLNRKNFFLVILGALFIGIAYGILLSSFPESSVALEIGFEIVFGLFSVITIPASLRRAHDIGWKGTWVLVSGIFMSVVTILQYVISPESAAFGALASFVLVAEIVVGIFLVFVAGDVEANKYGEVDTFNHLKTLNITAVTLNEK